MEMERYEVLQRDSDGHCCGLLMSAAVSARRRHP